MGEPDVRPMPTRGALLALLACLLFAGCAFPARESTSDEPGTTRDTAEYSGSGVGLAIQLVNRHSDPFDVEVVVRTSDGDEVARYATQVAPNATVEKWWSLGTGGHHVEMDYRMRSGARTSSGDDQVSVEVGGDCAELTRVGWRFVSVERTVGSAYLGRSCAAASG